MSKKLVSVLLLTVLVASIALVGCSSSSGTATPAPAAKKDQAITVGLQMSPKNLDPRLARDVVTQETVALLFDGLYRLDKNMEPQPWLAEKTDISADNKTYTITLKKGVKFQDGSDLTANDVKYTLDSIMDPNFKSPSASDLKYVKSITVVDPLTLKIELNTVYNRFLGSLNFGIVPEKVAKAAGDKFGTQPVGSGAYKLDTFKVDDTIAISANPNWFKGKPTIDKVTFKIIPENTTRLTSLESGQIDMVLDGVLPADEPRLAKNTNLTIGKAVATDYEYVGFNLKVAPFKDNVKLRQAIAYALDKDAIAKNFEGYRTYISLPPNNWAYTDKVNHYDLNLDTAKKLLADAGYANGIKIPLKTSQGRADEAQIIKEQLKKINVDVDVQLLESATYLKDLADGNMVMFLHGWTGQTDPDQYTIFVSSQMPPAGANRNGYNNPKVDELYQKGREAMKKEDRMAIYAQAYKIMIDEDCAFVPVYTSPVINVYKSNIKGLEVAPYPVTILQSLVKAKVE